jgi:WD40 repeat protein
VVSGNSEKQLKLWETATARPLWSIETKAGEISAVAVSPDGTIIAVGGSEKSVHLYAVADGKWMKSFEMSESKIRDVAFSADGRLVWAAGQDGVVRAWDAATGRESCSWRSQTGWGGWRSIAFSPDNKMALAAFEKELRLYETATGQLVRLFKGHDGTVRSVAFTPDGRHIVSGADDKTVRLWETATAKEIRVMRGHGKMVLKVAVSPDGRFAASASEDDTVRLWKLWDDAPDTPAPPRSDNPVRPQQGGFGATSGAAAHKRSGESIDEA